MIRIALLFCFLAIKIYAQSIDVNYSYYKIKADSFYSFHDYKNAAIMYQQAFIKKKWPGDIYKAVIAWTLANYADSAFYNLNIIANRPGFLEYALLMQDSLLKILRADKRWPDLLAKVKLKNSNINTNLRVLIDSLAIIDQKSRTINTDHDNYKILRNIIDTYGYPDYDLVGEKSAGNFWLLVQHQDWHPAFQDSVLSLLKIAVDNDKANFINYAYLLDRVKANYNELQVYGTQMNFNVATNSYEPKPVSDPENLNKRRQIIGLDSEEEYIKLMNKKYREK